MIRRDQTWITGLALLGTACAIFQCWYIYLPAKEAALIDFCRLTDRVNCFESLSKHGAEIELAGVPVIPALTAVLVFQLLLCAFAWVASAARREAWLALAHLASFPVTGFVVYVLLNDYLVAKATSPTTLALATVGLTGCIRTVLRGLHGVRLRHGAGRTVAMALGAALFAFFLHGAGAARRDYAILEEEDALTPPRLRWASFATFVPRTGAATLGDPLAEHEVLLFVDPAQEASRTLMREAAEQASRYGSRCLIRFFARGDHGAQLVQAQQRGQLEAYLKKPQRVSEDLSAVRALVARQERAIDRLQIDAWPTAVFKGGRKSGALTLGELLRAAGCG